MEKRKYTKRATKSQEPSQTQIAASLQVSQQPQVVPPANTKPSTQEQKEQKPIYRFQSNLEKYQAKVLPQLLQAHGISVEQFASIVMNEVKKNQKLLDAFIANPSSMFASILAGAEIGLIPSEMLGEFYLIPRNLKQPDGNYKLTVTPLIGYKGLVNILMRNGDITRIHTEVVYEGDDFTPIYGLEPNIIHKPDFTKPRKAENISFVYAVAKNKMGEYQFAVLSRTDIMAIKDMSKYDNELYFNDKKNPNRWMERKAALIQLSKMLPKDYYSKKAISMDGMMEGGAILTLDENNQVKIIEGTPIQKPTRFRSIYSTISNAPQLPESSQE